MRKAKRLRLPLPASVSSFFSSAHQQAPEQVDVLLIGGGIMSATMGTYLQELAPDWTVLMVERLDDVAKESSNGWNNAGTGHAALAELNYTPQMPDGTINIDKAIKVNESFQISRQFWAHQVERKVLGDPESFIHTVDHMSFVWGDDNVAFLKARHEKLKDHPLFQNMEYTEDKEQLSQWAPLLMQGRAADQKVAATRSGMGTDVDYGAINRQLVNSLQQHPNFMLRVNNEVRKLQQNADKSWTVKMVDLVSHQQRTVIAKHVFIGAGGAALPLLQASGIPEADGYGGFPVGGQFLICDNPEVVRRHNAKAYGKAEVGAPPMSVPHLDTRYLDGKDVLLFGPFATFSTKFLKNGSLFDLIRSTTTKNFLPMTRVGLDNLNLVKYLVSQVRQNDDDRFNELRKYYPNANKDDWQLWTAGQRVQIIKKDKRHGGQLQFGTEVVAAADGTLAALLGASPGASTAAPIIMDVLGKMFPAQVQGEWRDSLKAIIPSYGTKLNNDRQASCDELNYTSEILRLHKLPEPDTAAPLPNNLANNEQQIAS